MELITNSDLQAKIFTIRGVHVMIDRDLAALYGVQTKVLNQAVNRNKERFPENFCFTLSKVEFQNWRSQFVTSNSEKMGLRHTPKVFTEQGVAMLSSVIRSETAIRVSIQIMETFVQIRKKLTLTDELFHRLIFLEKKQNYTDEKVEMLLQSLESKENFPTKGIFFEGQLFDAYIIANEIIKSAKKSIILIDNYVDETTLLMLSKRHHECKAIIYTSKINNMIIRYFP